MALITLDDVVHYRPPAESPHFKPLQGPRSHDRIHPQSYSDRPAPLYPCLPSQDWRSSLPLSGHTPYLESHFHASSEVETLLAANELAEEVTIDCSNELDMNSLNVSSRRDANVAVSNVHTASRDLPDDVSNSDLGLGLYDQRHNGTWCP
jgi:hypothetical protein